MRDLGNSGRGRGLRRSVPEAPWGPGRGGRRARGSMDAEAARGATGEWRGGSPAAGPPGRRPARLLRRPPSWAPPRIGFQWLGWSGLRGPALQKETVHRALRAAGKLSPESASEPRTCGRRRPNSRAVREVRGSARGAPAPTHRRRTPKGSRSPPSRPFLESPAAGDRRGSARLSAFPPSLGGLGRSRWEGSVKRLGGGRRPCGPARGLSVSAPAQPAGRKPGVGAPPEPALSGEPGEPVTS